jgi:hypothetical protein
LVVGALVVRAFVLVALAVEAKHDLRVNTPAVVEVDRN